MGITLKENGLLAILYKWFYCTIILPKSLCPFFWKELIAVILGIPIFIFTLPMFPWYLKDLNTFKKNPPNNFDINTDYFWYIRDNLPLIGKGWFYRFMASLSCWIVIWFLLYILYGIYNIIIGNFEHGSSGMVIILFITIIITTGIVVLYFLFKYLIKYLSNRKTNKSESSIVISEFIKAKIGKYCPKITWK